RALGRGERPRGRVPVPRVRRVRVRHRHRAQRRRRIPARMSSQARRIVVITGAGGTLGAALSNQFAGEPDTDVVLSDISALALEATVSGTPPRRGAVETLTADVSELTDVEAVVARAIDRFGRLDVLV